MDKIPSGRASAERPPSPEKKAGQKVLLLIDGKEVLGDADEFFEKYGVDNWVRFHSSEFDDIDPQSEYIGHFNLKETNSVEGKKYILLKILKNGVKGSETQEERPPLLSTEGALIAECLEVKSHIPYSELTAEHFKYPLKNITDTESLKKKILERYKNSRPGITPEKVEEDGVAYTLFKVIKKVEDD